MPEVTSRIAANEVDVRLAFGIPKIRPFAPHELQFAQGVIGSQSSDRAPIPIGLHRSTLCVFKRGIFYATAVVTRQQFSRGSVFLWAAYFFGQRISRDNDPTTRYVVYGSMEHRCEQASVLAKQLAGQTTCRQNNLLAKDL